MKSAVTRARSLPQKIASRTHGSGLIESGESSQLPNVTSVRLPLGYDATVGKTRVQSGLLVQQRHPNSDSGGANGHRAAARVRAEFWGELGAAVRKV